MCFFQNPWHPQHILNRYNLDLAIMFLRTLGEGPLCAPNFGARCERLYQ